MSSFNVVELSFEPIDHTPTLEDEFTMTAALKEIEKIEDMDKLRQASVNLLFAFIQQKAVVRGLCKRLAEIETYGLTTQKYKG
tara:strand:- start:218 stop:466 length:249 start_codon:yes stop_codon:yes gene_type:complete